MPDALKSPSLTAVSLDADYFASLLEPFSTIAPVVAIAVSGGPDSMALAFCLHRWAKSKLVAFVIDHALRPESSAEAEQVKSRLGKMGVEAHILTWAHAPVSGRLHEKARAARYALLTEACHRFGATDLFLGHNREDQAETVLMRLSKGSHIEGLSGMASKSMRGGVRLLRPFLDISKERLMATCAAAHLDYVSDPSNLSGKFARGRLRKILPLLADEGLTVESLVTLSNRARETSDAITFYAHRLLRDAAHFDFQSGTVSINRDLWREVPFAIGLRALSHCLRQVHSGDYPPDRASTASLLESILDAPRPTVRTLHGCLISLTTKQTTILREFQAIKDIIPVQKHARVLWDKRWQVEINCEISSGAVVRSLGSPSHLTLDRLAPGLRRRVSSGRVRSTLPGLWVDGTLLAIPSLSPDAPLRICHVNQAFP